MPPPAPDPCLCQGCKIEFASRNAVFKHLKDNSGECLDAVERKAFQRYVLMAQRTKCLILYGYVVLPPEFDGLPSTTTAPAANVPILNGHDAAVQLLQVLEEDIEASMSDDDDKDNSEAAAPTPIPANKINRSYTNAGRNEEMLGQDDRTGAISEVLSTKLPVLLLPLDEWIDSIHARLAAKGYHNNLRLLGRLDEGVPGKFNAELDVTQRRIEYLLPADFLVAGQTQPLEGFYASLPSFVDGNYNLSLKRHSTIDGAQQIDGIVVENKSKIGVKQQGDSSKMNDLESINLEQKRPTPETLGFLHMLKKTMQSLTTKISDVVEGGSGGVEVTEKPPKQKRKRRDFKGKQQHGGGSKDKQKKNGRGKKNHQDNNKNQMSHGNQDNNNGKEQNDSENGHDKKSPVPQADVPPTSNDHANQQSGDTSADASTTQKDVKDKGRGNASAATMTTTTKVSRRRRFHNFTPSSLAHDFFAFRRMDRMYHRCTLRFPDTLYNHIEQQQPNFYQQKAAATTINNSTTAAPLNRNRPFVAVSVSGDLFLQGQTCRVIGLLIALARKVVDTDFVDCVFDEDYPQLVPTPEAPTFAMYAGEAYYTQWEGKVKKVLTPRKIELFPEGWGDPATLRRMHDWQTTTREEIARVWLLKGVDAVNGRLLAEKEWTEQVLEPWAVKARVRLEDYREWKSNRSANKTDMLDQATEVPVQTPLPLPTIDKSVPALYATMLQCLREADKSGLWPSTTAKRQMVMVSTPTDENGVETDTQGTMFSSLSAAHRIAKSNKYERASAYVFKEGEGGASGSFSVGAMPGMSSQPKANTLFPGLMKAAFELERALLPDRTGSSTIAVNRNAQFRPHTDSGAGVGQSTSLIVALGDFAGGELMVEGDKEDIRYRALEFDGWKQRHWTLPFQGERYSLVWFTPVGCEGVRGLDLCT